MVEVVIFIPGIMGSELFLGEKEDANRLRIWPGAISELFLPYQNMEKLLDPNLTVGDIIRRISVSTQYDSLVDALITCGFTENAETPTLRVCPYDWRKDNALAADVLAGHITFMRKAHGPEVVINIVAHSMGGLISRYFLESGEFSEKTHPGFANIRRLITIGTPHRGAPIALHAALGQMKRLFLSAKQVKRLANDPQFPALYQLLPPPAEPFLWDSNLASRLSPVNLYMPHISKKLGLSSANLDKTTAFHAALNIANQPAGVDYFCFVGTRQKTVSNIRYDFNNYEYTPPPIVETEDGGDGTVPSWSASVSGMQQLLVGGDHGSLYKPKEVLRDLAFLLGKGGVLAGSADDAIRISVHDEVVLPLQQVSLILFISDRTSLDADIVVHKLIDQDGGILENPAKIYGFAVKYSGPAASSISLKFIAPRYPGAYEIDILINHKSASECKFILFVQSPLL